MATRIADSSSVKAVSFSSARTTKRFPSSRCASKCRVPTAAFVVLNEILESDDCAGLNRCGEAAYKSSTALEFQFSSGTVFAKVFLDDVSINPAGVPDGGSTVSLLGCALLGVTVLRRKLRC